MRKVCLITISSLLMLFLSASGQQPAAPAPPPPPIPTNAPGSNAGAGAGGVATFSTGTNLVVREVTVTDKSGKPIEGLTKKDFTVTEDGQPMNISFVEYQNLPEGPGPALQTRADAATEHIVAPLDRLTRTEITPEAPGDIRYQNRRLLAMYFDMTSMNQADQLRALSNAEKFISTQMAPADLVSIMRYQGSSVDVLCQFTDDKDKLQSILETIIVGEGQGFGETNSDAAAGDSGAAFGQDDSEFNIFNTDRQLSAIQTAAKMLGRLNEKKVLLYFASGLQMNGVDNQAQLHATENAALRAGVQIWTMDARGLVAMAALGDSSQRTAGGNSLLTGGTQLAFSGRLQQSQDTLYTLAADTGGKAFLDNNDLTKGILNAEKSLSSYYILGYTTTNLNQDGKFRKIKITLNNGMVANIDFTQGYYGEKTWNKMATADKERQLEDALMAGDPITDLTISTELDFFELNTAEYLVAMTMKIPGRELALAKRRGAEHTNIDFIGEVKDGSGSTISNIRDKTGDMKLTDATAAELARSPIVYSSMFTLLPDKYTIKVLARDAETGRIGTYQTTFIVPNLMKETQRVAISSVVLSSQRSDLKEALFNALKDKDRAEASNPLVVDGQKMIPSVTRVFSKAKPMYVFLQAYQPNNDTAHPMVAFVDFFRGENKVFETIPIQVNNPAARPGVSPKLKTMPLRFDVNMAELQPGQYNVQVTVLDPQGQKASFWQAPVELIP